MIIKSADTPVMIVRENLSRIELSIQVLSNATVYISPDKLYSAQEYRDNGFVLQKGDVKELRRYILESPSRITNSWYAMSDTDNTDIRILEV